jgi:ABC-type multidrug transport system fused ATPase/permease subunit
MTRAITTTTTTTTTITTTSTTITAARKIGLPIDSDGDTHQRVSAKRLVQILLPEYKMMSAAMAGITVSALATMAFPDAIGKMIDLLTLPVTDTTLSEMQLISLGMVGIISVGSVATASHKAILETVGQKVGARLRKRLFSRLLGQNKAFFDKHKSGELVNRLSTDVHEVNT